tara:strand:- start:529 stop:1209 length:681 start_codon:yes stop_codon:yes gene_type:complete
MLVSIKFLIVIILITFLSGCKIDFTGDLYTSDLIDLANTEESKQFNLPMEVAYQVSDCETDEASRMISTYFFEFKNTGCAVGEDFMSYATAQVTVPVVNNYDIFNNANNSLIGFVAYLSKDKNWVYVDATISADLYESLKNYVYNETFQELSLTDSNLVIRLNNDLNSAVIEVPPSFVNNEPIVFSTEYTMERRDLLIIQASNVNSSFLENNLWTPLFLLNNSLKN